MPRPDEPSPTGPDAAEQLLFAERVLLDRLRPATVGFARGRITRVEPDRRLAGARALPDGAVLSPGFVDCQVNGGGGLLFNDAPDARTLETMVAAHRRGGTTTLLPTLITDRPGRIEAACAAVRAARAGGTPWSGAVAGIHLEGPFLSPLRPGVHRPELIRPMTAADRAMLEAEALRGGLGTVLLTLAPETAPPGAIAALAGAGIVVSAGHSEATGEQIAAALAAGLRGFTHLWNAMPPVASRAGGIVAAALADRTAWCGLIADLVHVGPGALALTLAAKPADRLFLVTDSMPPAGTDAAGFSLQGRHVVRGAGALRTADGTLAGADLDMAAAVRNLHLVLGVALERALAMATAVPAAFARLADRGAIRPGARADLVVLDGSLRVAETIAAGA